MSKFLPTILLASVFVSGCITQPYNVDQRINELESTLSTQFSTSCSEHFESLDQKIEKLKKTETKTITKIVERCSTVKTKQKKPTYNNKLLVGEVEKITLAKEAISLAARIDSGAVTSSLGVYNPKKFERDGDKWVRFSLTQDKDAPIYEYPVHDVVSIKQTRELSEERIEIKINIEVGGKVYKKQLFNLSDRSHLDYQLLIGRSFLKDIAVIDVGSKYLLNGE